MIVAAVATDVAGMRPSMTVRVGDRVRLGDALFERGERAGALAAYRESLELMEALGIQEDVASTLFNLARVLHRLRRLDEAEADLRRLVLRDGD